MIEAFTEFLNNIVAALNLEQFGGLIVLFGVAFITDIGIPFGFALDSLLMVAAYQAGPFSQQVLIMMVTLWLGRLVASSALYLMARLLGTSIITSRRLLKRFPSIPENLEKAKQKVGGQAPPTIALARLTPGLLQLSSIAAGVLRVEYWHFFAGVTLASAIYDVFVILIGTIARGALASFHIDFSPWLVIGATISIPLIWLGIRLAIARRNHVRNKKNGRNGKNGNGECLPPASNPGA
jgi:membrane protein DedA with SNARE-associated domain